MLKGVLSAVILSVLFSMSVAAEDQTIKKNTIGNTPFQLSVFSPIAFSPCLTVRASV